MGIGVYYSPCHDVSTEKVNAVSLDDRDECADFGNVMQGVLV